MKFSGRILFLCLLLLQFGCASIDEKSTINPGTRPEIESTEGGLWLMMDKHEESVKRDGRLVKDPQLNQYVNSIVCNLAGPYCSDIRVYILQVNDFNASMAPNGMMVVYTGLLLRVKNESQLAAILGHEITHYVKQHSLKRFLDIQAKADSMTVLSIALLGVGMPVGSSELLGLILSGEIAAYSREHELEADSGGLEMLVKSNYSPGGAAQVWEQLITEHKAGGEELTSSFLATHPHPEDRIKNIREQVDSMSVGLQPKVGQVEYLEVVGSMRGKWLKDELARGKFKETEEVLRQMVPSSQYPGEVYFYKGELIRLQGEKDYIQRSVEEYQKAIDLDPQDPRPRKAIGLMLMKTAQKQRAADNLEIYLRLNPASKDRKMIEKFLEELR